MAMQRTYLPWLGLALAGSVTVTATNLPASWAASVFNSRPLDQARFAVLAQPVGNSAWKLLVLEQIKPAPLCWQERPDGLIDPALNRFDFTGICSRYLDSNGYSLRIGDDDLASRYRLRLEQQGAQVALLAMSPSQPVELLVGRGQANQRDRDGFVALKLEPGWQLERRAFGSQTLSHVYFANRTPLAQLLAAASAEPQQPQRSSRRAATALREPPPSNGSNSSTPIALQVIPFKP